MSEDREQDPKIIESPLSRRIEDGSTYVDIEIYRLEHEHFWTLEVADALGGSTVWDDEFSTDEEALEEAMAAIEEEGLVSFMIEGDEVSDTVH